MKKSTINLLATITIVVGIISLATYILIKDNPTPLVNAEEAKCIGQNSELYVQTGCSACRIQEEMFGENVKYINVIDCFLTQNRQLCIEKNIEAFPTWIINREKYKGIQEIEVLKSLTNC
ncbi:MAG: hypothetical protein ABIH28_03220 [archaeon]